MTTTHHIPASQLHPGDIVLTPNGDRWFAAFDVSGPAGNRRHHLGVVRVWTAISDQDNGQPATRDFDPTTGLHVQRP